MVFHTVLLLYYTVHFCVYFLGRKFAAAKFSAQKVFFLRNVLPKDFLPKSLILLQFICPLHDFLPIMRFSAQMFDFRTIYLPNTWFSAQYEIFCPITEFVPYIKFSAQKLDSLTDFLPNIRGTRPNCGCNNQSILCWITFPPLQSRNLKVS